MKSYNWKFNFGVKTTFLCMVLGMLMFTQCNSHSKSKNQMDESEKQKLIDEGFVHVKIVNNKDEACFVLLKKADGEKLDPINWVDYFKEDMNDGDEIWLQYRLLKRMSRCPDTIPVQIQTVHN